MNPTAAHTGSERVRTVEAIADTLTNQSLGAAEEDFITTVLDACGADLGNVLVIDDFGQLDFS